MYLKFSKIRHVKTPVRANPSDAIDIFVPLDFVPQRIDPNCNLVLPSGLKFEVPYGQALLCVNKSGIASKKELMVGACLIDHGYNGEVHIDLHNVGKKPQYISPGDKIVQLIQINVAPTELIEVDEVNLYKQIPCVSDRGEGKMGSTGVK